MLLDNKLSLIRVRVCVCVGIKYMFKRRIIKRYLWKERTKSAHTGWGKAFWSGVVVEFEIVDCELEFD